MSRTPLYDELCRFAGKNPVSFHMPGHKNGRGLKNFMSDKNIFRLDVTELDGLDNLKAPNGIIARAENVAAKAFGAKRTFFSVNGSSGAILAAVYATINRGDTVLVDRGCHESVINALKICGAKAVFVSPEIDGEFGLPTGICAEKIKSAFFEHNNIKLVIVTSPNYFGRISPISEIAEITHNNGALLLIDEAHGAHFCFGKSFPETAMGMGADIAVQSMHKTLPCPNQTALLHIGSDRVSCERIKEAINMFQTTSPSYILMACMDYARDVMEHSCNQIEDTANIILQAKQRSKLKIFNNHDPFRLVVNSAQMGVTGYALSERLIREQNIYAEGADLANIIFILNQYNTKDEITRLFELLENMRGDNSIEINVPVLKDSFSWDFSRKFSSEKIPVSCAAGRQCGSNITVYPPCVPVILTGEVIEEQTILYINKVVKNGGNVMGTENGMIEVICGYEREIL